MIDLERKRHFFESHFGVEGRKGEKFDIPWAPSFQPSGRGSSAEAEGSSQASGLKESREEDDCVVKQEALN